MPRFIPLFLFAVLVSCVPPQGSYTGAKQWPLEASKDKAWDAIIAVFTDRGLTIQTIEKDSGVVTTAVMPTQNKAYFVDCARAMDIVHQYSIRLAIVLRDIPDGTSALTINTTSAVYKKGFMSDWVWSPCPSSGLLEVELVRNIRTTLGIQDISPQAETR